MSNDDILTAKELSDDVQYIPPEHRGTPPWFKLASQICDCCGVNPSTGDRNMHASFPRYGGRAATISLCDDCKATTGVIGWEVHLKAMPIKAHV